MSNITKISKPFSSLPNSEKALQLLIEKYSNILFKVSHDQFNCSTSIILYHKSGNARRVISDQILMQDVGDYITYSVESLIADYLPKAMQELAEGNLCAYIPPPAKLKPLFKSPDLTGLPHMGTMVKSPVGGSYNTLEKTIILLNDFYQWTREHIADWLETLDLDLEIKSVDKQEMQGYSIEDHNIIEDEIQQWETK